MRIISWNVNGIRATEKKGEIQNLIQEHDPDIFFMQEIKATPDKLSPYLLAPPNYTAHYNPAEKAGYAGTGVWIHDRVYEQATVRFLDSFPDDPTANEGRVAHVELKMKTGSFSSDKREGEGTLSQKTEQIALNLPLSGEKGEIIDIFGIYFPNGGKSEDAWKGKIVFYSVFAKYMDVLRENGHYVLWGGDLNCAHHEIDLARPKENAGKIGFHPLERAWLDGRVQDGWHDIFRVRNPDQTEVYSWWDVITRSRERNVGWRIDAWWGNEGIEKNTNHIEYLPRHMGSDHCPLLIDLRL